MDLINETSDCSSELLEAQAQVWNCTFNFINSMSLKCAVELGIPDIIHSHGKPMTHLQIASALDIQPSKAHCIQRLMHLLIHSGFFARQKLVDNQQEEGYVLTNASKLLLKNNPLVSAPFVQAMLDPIMTKPWQHVSTWLQNNDDSAAFETAHGMNFYEYLGHEPRLNHLFNDAMASDTRLATSLVISKCKHVFEGLDSLVDVGGSAGSVAKAIAKEFPHIECTVFDLPHVVADLKSDIVNLKYVAGDMFNDVLPPAEALLLKAVLHNWNDEECVKILKNCKEAITSNGKKGKVIIIEMMMMEDEKADEKSVETQLFFDMQMMIVLTGKQRSEKEWVRLFLEAGFSDYKISPILGLRSLIEVFP